MSEAPLAPPESRPDDDEDVAWALQTASTLWARGEAADAFVWLRRAADAATRAGQDYRASELGLHAAAMEEAMRDAVADPPTLDEIDVRMSGDRMSLDRMSIEVEPDMLEEVTSDGPPVRILPPPVPSGPPTRSPGGPPPPPPSEARPHVAVPPPVPTSKSAASPPHSSAPTAGPPSHSAAPASRRDTHRPWSQKPTAPLDLDLGPDSLSPVEVRSAPSVVPPSMTAPPFQDAPRPAPPPPVAPASAAASPPPPVPAIEQAPPSLSTHAIPPPPSPTPPPAAHRASSSSLEGATPTSTRTPLSEAPASASPLSTFRSFAGVPSVAAPPRAKRKPRAPIFDPWADDVPQDSLPAAGAGVEGQAWDDSAVFTSAAALDVLLRKRPPPPPPRRRTQTVDMSPSQRPPLPPAAMGGAEATASETTPTPPVSAAQAASPGSTSPPAPPVAEVAAPLAAEPPAPPRFEPTPPAAVPLAAPQTEADAVGPQARAAAPAEPAEARAPAASTPEERRVPSTPPPSARPSSPPPRPPSVPPRPASHPDVPAPPGSVAPPPGSLAVPPPPPMAPPPAPAPMTAPAPVVAPPPPASVAPPPPAPVAPPRPSTAPRPTSPPRPGASTPPPSFRAPPAPGLPSLDGVVARAPSSPSAAEAPAAPPPAAPIGSSPPSSLVLGGLSLERAESLSDLPPNVQRAVMAAAEVVDLDSDEEVADFGVVLVLSGEIAVCAAVNDAPACRFPTGSLAPSRGSFENGVSTRAVAFAGPARIARWELAGLREALQSCPWVLDELEERGDRVQARVGATLGPLGDLDDMTRSSTLDALTLRVLAPGELAVEKGSPGTGIMIIGGGSVEVEGGGAREILGCGDPLFAGAALSGSPAPGAARAGAGGALLLVADRRGTQGLVTSLPTLLELLASS